MGWNSWSEGRSPQARSDTQTDTISNMAPQKHLPTQKHTHMRKNTQSQTHKTHIVSHEEPDSFYIDLSLTGFKFSIA